MKIFCYGGFALIFNRSFNLYGDIIFRKIMVTKKQNKKLNYVRHIELDEIALISYFGKLPLQSRKPPPKRHFV